MNTGVFTGSLGLPDRIGGGACPARSASAVSRRGTAAILVGLAALLVVARAHTYHEPLERDITTYAVIAHELRLGRALYSDLWDHKPPGIHLTYVAAEALVGYGEASIFLLNVAAAVATLLGAYAAGSAGPWGRRGGLWAAVFWTLVSGDLALQANQPNTEVFINAALLWAFALYLRGDAGPLSWPRAIAIGGLALAASLHKPHQLAVVAVLGAVAILAAGPGRRARALVRGAAAAGIAGIGWGATWAYFWLRGRAAAFEAALVDHNLAYAGDPVANLVASLRPAEVPAQALPVLAPLAALTAAGFALGARTERGRWALLAAFVLATHAVIALPGQFHPHYYQQWLPPLAVGAAWSVVEIGRRLAGRAPWAGHAPGAVAAAALLATQLPGYGLEAAEWSRQKYGDVFATSRDLGAKIDQWLAPGESFYLWGNESGVYFASRRRPPTGLFQAYPFVEWLHNPRRDRPDRADPGAVDAAYARLRARTPALERMEARLLADLERSRPELVVRYRAWPPPPPRLRAWLEAHYRPFAEIGGFRLSARADGALRARLAAIAPAPGR